LTRRGAHKTQSTEQTRRAAVQIANRRGAPKGERLTRALINLAAQGLRTHCSDPGSHSLWLSEHDGERAEAARLCTGCPVIEPCGEAAGARREKFGVWGGKDVTRMPGTPGQPPSIRTPVDAEPEAGEAA
jgi:hypothetical protein